MDARKVFMGCTVTAVVILALVVVGGIITYNRLTAPIPLPVSTRLVDADSVGHAVLRLDPDNPWIRQIFSEMSKFSTREPRTSDLFPIEVVWSAHLVGPEAEGHMLSAGFSPRGRLFGFMTDVALWKAGRSSGEKVTRVEYGGEGITAFPGTPIRGNVFVRGNAVVWASDLEMARRAVDLLVAREKTDTATGEETSAAPRTPAPPVMSLVPTAGHHVLIGAIAGEQGAAARCLTLIPGDALDMPDDGLARASLSFAFDAISADVAAGEVTLHFPPDTPAPVIDRVAGDLARRIASLKWGEVVFETSPSGGSTQSVIAVKASGLTTVYRRLLEESVKVQKTLEKAHQGEDIDVPVDPNQSNSTFQ